jgi:hypothetical protein
VTKLEIHIPMLYNYAMKISSYSNTIAGCLFGIVIGYIIGAYGINLSQILKQAGIPQITSTTTTSYFIEVSDQMAGDSVVINTVDATKDSWVAIRENNYDVMGRILGAQKVGEGEHNNVVVDLLKPTIQGLMYATVIYEDNGDGEFDFKTDKLIEIATGTPVLSRFVAR